MGRRAREVTWKCCQNCWGFEEGVDRSTYWKLTRGLRFPFKVIPWRWLLTGFLLGYGTKPSNALSYLRHIPYRLCKTRNWCWLCKWYTQNRLGSQLQSQALSVCTWFTNLLCILPPHTLKCWNSSKRCCNAAKKGRKNPLVYIVSSTEQFVWGRVATKGLPPLKEPF